jgi:hypothetical protein
VAVILTLVAIGVGVGLGLRWGGTPANVLEWRPVLWPLAVTGIAVWALLDLTSLTGGWAAFLRILAVGAVFAFAVLNIRTGGMVLVAAGLGLNLLVMVLNWGMPVSASALASAGVADSTQAAQDLVLSGGREVASGAVLGFLGDVIPLPWGQVISIGDVLWLVGLALVVSSVLRRYEVRGGGRPRSHHDALSALNRGPAPRRGPGLHPSRMPDRRRRRP